MFSDYWPTEKGNYSIPISNQESLFLDFGCKQSVPIMAKSLVLIHSNTIIIHSWYWDPLCPPEHSGFWSFLSLTSLPSFSRCCGTLTRSPVPASGFITHLLCVLHLAAFTCNFLHSGALSWLGHLTQRYLGGFSILYPKAANNGLVGRCKSSASLP